MGLGVGWEWVGSDLPPRGGVDGCGVHWFTDILGSVLLSVGLFYIYKGAILLYDR